jgi:hypothetical protein
MYCGALLEMSQPLLPMGMKTPISMSLLKMLWGWVFTIWLARRRVSHDFECMQGFLRSRGFKVTTVLLGQ